MDDNDKTMIMEGSIKLCMYVCLYREKKSKIQRSKISNGGKQTEPMNWNIYIFICVQCMHVRLYTYQPAYYKK